MDLSNLRPADGAKQSDNFRRGRGHGSGCLLYTSYWVAVVKPGRVMFELAGVPEEVAREALRLAMHKLPCKCKIVSREDLEGGDNSEN